MAEFTHDVVGIGNAIVDILGRCKDDFLIQHGAPKGHMRLVDADTISKLYEAMGPGIEISGGSVANTMVGIASFGGSAAFIGKVADDDFGRVFAHDIRASGVTFNTQPARQGSPPTARSLILITPNGERTMNTFLGVSPELARSEIDAELIASARILYLEGYLFDRPEAKAAFRHAADLADKSGCQVALTLSDAFCVDRHRAEFQELVRTRVDILFANESEITSLYQTSSFNDAARQARAAGKLVVLTRSEKGSLIYSGDKAITVPAERVKTVVDATGAGDLYAAGFLYGLASGKSLETCGRLGSLAAAEVISHIGARPETPLNKLAAARGL
ncbi:MAG: adenosine kinase [Bacteroidota bacterium]|jgi:sugar/nucleoside kinase (ribokinase family)